jgi:hypothetical protein
MKQCMKTTLKSLKNPQRILNESTMNQEKLVLSET